MYSTQFGNIITITHFFRRVHIHYYVACIEMEKSARKIWKMKGNQENNFNKNQEQRATLYAYNIFGMYIPICMYLYGRDAL